MISLRKAVPILAIIVSILLAAVSTAQAETRIASWNVKRLTDDNKNVEAMVDILSYFDLVALQEVMDEEGLPEIVEGLQAKTGVQWGVMMSHAIGRGTYKERYAFIWRTSHVEFVDSAIVYLDSADVFAREPLSARFRSKEDGFSFIMANIHILYGDGRADRVPEIEALRAYWQWLGETFPEEQFFVAGDFNLKPEDPAFGLLKRFASPVITSGATTLSKTTGKYANLYDNIWIPNNIQASMKSGILDFPSILGISHEEARSTISDHAPVYLFVDQMDETTGHYDHKLAGSINASATPVRATVAYVRGNKSSKIYHLPGCPSYETMKNSSNLVEFMTDTQAEQAGFRKAGNCDFAK